MASHIGLTVPTVAEVVKELKQIVKEFGKDPESSLHDEEGLDVRLQVLSNGQWYVHYGDPGYDTDHHGFWGAGSLLVDSDLKALAEDLISQVEDDAAQSGEFEGHDRSKKQHHAYHPDAMKRAVAFFYKHAGSSYTPGKETKAQGQRRGAKALAEAEAEAKERGWTFEWEHDPEPYEKGDAEIEDPDEVLGCVLKDEDGKVLASLWGIGDPDHNYRRVVEAELAQEALG